MNIDEAFLERFGRQLLVRGWTLRSQEQLAEARIAIHEAADITREYLRGAGAEQLVTFRDSPLRTDDTRYDVVISLSPLDDPLSLLRSPLGLYLECGDAALSMRYLTGEARRIPVPESACSGAILQTVAGAAVMRALLSARTN